MTPFEAIQKIQQMFAEAKVVPVDAAEPMPSAEPTEAAKEYVLQSGVKVMIDKLEVGGQVMVLDEGGNMAPAPIGEHILADGTKITVDEAGSIVAVETPKAEVIEDVVEEVPAAAPEMMEKDEMKKKIEEMQKDLDEMKSKFEAAEAKVSAQEAKFSKGISDLSDVLIQLMQTSSAAPTEQPKEKFNKHLEPKENKIAKFLEFAKSIK